MFLPCSPPGLAGWWGFGTRPQAAQKSMYNSKSSTGTLRVTDHAERTPQIPVLKGSGVKGRSPPTAPGRGDCTLWQHRAPHLGSGHLWWSQHPSGKGCRALTEAPSSACEPCPPAAPRTFPTASSACITGSSALSRIQPRVLLLLRQVMLSLETWRMMENRAEQPASCLQRGGDGRAGSRPANQAAEAVRAESAAPRQPRAGSSG